MLGQCIGLETSIFERKQGRNTLDHTDCLLAGKYAILRHSRQRAIKRCDES
jgi:hypothetical protein